jgi:NTP pyrophosphatase (non-canonical NTP hydrolase)
MNIEELIEESNKTARRSGFWDGWDEAEQGSDEALNNLITTKIMLAVTELGEAVEALRKDDMEEFTEEIADTFIRLADLAGQLGLQLEDVMIEKMERNKTRPYRHGKSF